VNAVRVVTLGALAGPAGDADDAVVLAALARAGVAVESRVWVEEDEGALERALGPGAALTVILAGPGGTSGEVVRRVLARAAGVRLTLHDKMLAALEAVHRRHDRPLPRSDERLALLPQSAVVWAAEAGEPAWALDAPAGAVVVLGRGGALVPAIERRLVDFARPRLAARGGVAIRTLKTAGVTREAIEARLPARAGDVVVAVLPAEGGMWVRLSARGATPEDAAAALAPVEAEITAALGADCWGRDGDTLEEVVGRRLAARGLTLAVAESCTGGLLGHRLTSVPGASAYFERGVIVYSNRAKTELLGVPDAVLRAHGAVSAECAEAMARGVVRVAGSDCGIAVTGVAGPDGGSPAKPVGTVFIGVAVGEAVEARRFLFGGGRASVKWQSAEAALDLLRRRLEAER